MERVGFRRSGNPAAARLSGMTNPPQPTQMCQPTDLHPNQTQSPHQAVSANFEPQRTQQNYVQPQVLAPHNVQQAAPIEALPPAPDTHYGTRFQPDSPYGATHSRGSVDGGAGEYDAVAYAPADQSEKAADTQRQTYIKAHLGFWFALLAAIGSLIFVIVLAKYLENDNVLYALEYDAESPEATYATLLASVQLVWTALGIAGLVLGILATIKNQHRGLGVAAICVAASAPFISFGAFAVMALFQGA